MVDKESLETIVSAVILIVLNYFAVFYVFIPFLDVLMSLDNLLYDVFGIYVPSFSEPLPPIIKTIIGYAFWIFSSIVTFVSLLRGGVSR